MRQLSRLTSSKRRQPPARGWSLLLLSLIFLAVCGAGVARAETGIITPLGSLGISKEETMKVQRWIRAAVSTIPKTRWIGTRRITRLLQKQRYRGCERDASCLGPLARKLGADLAIAGEVGSLGDAYMVYLRLVSAKGQAVRTVNGVLDPRVSGLRAITRSLAYRLLAPKKFVGSIKVKVDVPNAWIYLDGRRIARSPADTLKNIPVGTHALRVTHEAYRDFVRFVELPFEEEMAVDVALSAFPVKAEEMRLAGPGEGTPLADGDLPWYRRWWAVTTFGAVILAATATTVALSAQGSFSRDTEIVVPR